MAKTDLPRFVIYQPNTKEFHICLQVGGSYYRWLSNYPPTLDVRYQRQVERIEDLAANKIPKKNIYDEGTYTVTKSDTRETAEKKLEQGLQKRSVGFILNGKKLKGRFSIKQTSTGTVIQKFKDKYAAEEDVLSGDLSRTISSMIPDYDEKKITLHQPKKAARKKQQELPEEPEEEITADTTIGSKQYHFAFYTADDEPDICLVTGEDEGVMVLKKLRNKWGVMPPVPKSATKKESEFISHLEALLKMRE